MNAVSTELLRQAKALSTTVVQPIPGSRKIYLQGSRTDLRVPMREVVQADTPSDLGAESNPPLAVYDTSGPYTDSQYHVDLVAGLPALRKAWIEERNDTEPLPAFSSPFSRRHADATELAAVRFPTLRAPRRAGRGNNVTQMHYARRGLLTPEMEFVAIRENQRLEALTQAGLLLQHPGQAYGAVIPKTITPEFVRDEIALGRAIIPNNLNHPESEPMT
ncbi:MAG TPA: phosphomethylpyrimidine synthase ThiC, partial [Mizugakiibacter sp.]|nr:phosphomethylpyrimidine synthase ThiC [Mizugakiibacter sp.]